MDKVGGDFVFGDRLEVGIVSEFLYNCISSILGRVCVGSDKVDDLFMGKSRFGGVVGEERGGV